MLPFPKYALAWRNLIFRYWSSSVVRLLKIEVEVTNAPPVGAFLLVSNHLSYLDVVLLASQVDCTFIAKSDVSRWPAIGALARLVKTIFVDRNNRRDVVGVLKKMEKSIDDGLGVVLFAEGTSTSGRSVSPFKSSLLEFASRRKLPVHCASISYSTRASEPSADQSVCWWGDMTFTDHFFRLMQLTGVSAKLTFGREPVVASDRRVLSTKLWQAVNAQFTPVAAH